LPLGCAKSGHCEPKRSLFMFIRWHQIERFAIKLTARMDVLVFGGVHLLKTGQWDQLPPQSQPVTFR
jgi:hypothetical protein